MRISVYRYNPETDKEPRFQRYDVECREEWVVLDALNHVKETLDPTLSYRWSCHMAVCGSCGMMVNNEPKLACKAFLRDYAGVAAVVYGVAAELEEKPARRVPWFEARVRKLKEVEGHVERAVRTGGLQAQALNVARFQRLQAEADLLRLKADVEKGKGK